MPDTTVKEAGRLLETLTALDPETRTSLVIFVIGLAVLVLLRILLTKLVMWQTTDPRRRYTWRKTISYISTVIIIVMAARLFFHNIGSVATFLGLITAALTIALKDIVVNLAAWLYILWRRPFSVGDRIQIGEHSGDVIDIHALHFTLIEIGNWVEADQSTGRIIEIPNGLAFSQPLANSTKEFNYIWNEVPVLITFESNWNKAKDILHRVALKHAEKLSTPARESIRRASEKYWIFYKNLTPTVYTSVKDCGVSLTIRYLTEPRNRRGSEQGIWEDILYQFGRARDIDFAYPTTRFYDNRSEGKPEIRKGEPAGGRPD